MLCPHCKAELVVTGQERLETLDEHVCCANTIAMKDKYECSDINCLTRKLWVFWNEFGEVYSDPSCPFRFSVLNDTHIFIDRNYAPFGSITRKMNVEIGNTRNDYTLLKTKNWEITVRYSYQSDLDGNILKKRACLQFDKKDKNGSWIRLTPFWRKIANRFRIFYRSRRYYLMFPNNSFAVRQMKNQFSRGLSRDKVILTTRICNWFFNTFHSRLRKKVAR